MSAVLQLNEGEALAQRLRTLREAKKAIEVEINTVEAQILALYPGLSTPDSGPCGPFSASFRRSLVLDEGKTWAWLAKRAAVRPFFGLRLSVEDWETLGSPKIGVIKVSKPSIRLL